MDNTNAGDGFFVVKDYLEDPDTRFIPGKFYHLKFLNNKIIVRFDKRGDPEPRGTRDGGTVWLTFTVLASEHPTKATLVFDERKNLMNCAEEVQTDELPQFLHLPCKNRIFDRVLKGIA